VLPRTHVGVHTGFAFKHEGSDLQRDRVDTAIMVTGMFAFIGWVLTSSKFVDQRLHSSRTLPWCIVFTASMLGLRTSEGPGSQSQCSVLEGWLGVVWLVNPGYQG
jgi:hypothetical protein